MFARVVAVPLILLCACDGVFGLHHLHADIDAPGSSDVAVVTSAHAHGKESKLLTLSVIGVEGSHQLLLVYAAVGDYCSDSVVSSATATYDGAAPMPIHMLMGTPCAANLSRSYLWEFPDPPAGPHDVVVNLDATAHSFHAGAVLVSGVDPENPVRAIGSSSGRSLQSAVDVTSEVGDLVLAFIGQGGGISDADAGATLVYVDNLDNATTLNNTGASTIAGASPSVTTRWRFNADDEWQGIALSLRRAP